MDTYTKDGKQYVVGVRSRGNTAVSAVTIIDKNGREIGYAEGVDATRLIHREFNADGTPWTHYDPDRPF